MSMVTALNGTFACLGFDGFFGYLPISAQMGGSTWVWSGFTTFLWTLLAICISWGPEPILTCTVHVILDLIMKHWNPDVRQSPKFLAPRQSIHHFGGPETELCRGGLYISRRVTGYYPDELLFRNENARHNSDWQYVKTSVDLQKVGSKYLGDVRFVQYQLF